VSRVGKKPVAIPKGVQINVRDGRLTTKGPKGELSVRIPDEIKFNQEGDTIVFERSSDDKHIRALHGLTRALTASSVEGVTNGFQRNLQIEGVGFRAELRGKNLLLSLGYSHPILFMQPEGVEFSITSPTAIQVKGIDKQLIGEVAAKIRKLRKPEPYKGKGVRYEGEYIRRKAGKSAGK
jgi:large subunit ribosomal protein L6